MGDIQWGNVAEWSSAIGTVLAFGAALALLRHEQQDRAEMHRDQMTEQARLVSAWCTHALDSGGHVNLRNGSDEPVYDVRVFLGDMVAASDPGQYRRAVLAPGPAGPVFVDASAGSNWSSTGDGPVGLAFTDARGKRWFRAPNGRLLLTTRFPEEKP